MVFNIFDFIRISCNDFDVHVHYSMKDVDYSYLLVLRFYIHFDVKKYINVIKIRSLILHLLDLLIFSYMMYILK